MTTYTPAMAQALRLKGTPRALWLIYAADGTVLDAVRTGDGMPPPWVDGCTERGEMARLLEIQVTPAVWRRYATLAAVRPESAATAAGGAGTA
jgi:hypothetical protein